MRHFISVSDFSKDEILKVLKKAISLKESLKKGSTDPLLDKKLQGKSVGMIFSKPSNRTRVSFEVGLNQFGVHPIYLKSEEVGIGIRETAEDVAKVLSRYVQGIVIRNDSFDELVRFSESADVPVINALTDLNHPCQAMADAMTLLEIFESFDKFKMTYVGDGNNVCYSLIQLAQIVGLDLTVCCPKGFEPELSEGYRLDRDISSATKDADVVYTDVWTSMGQESEQQDRLTAFKGYQVNASIMETGRKKLFMHCLPAHRGEEVSSDVLASDYSIVLDQAENRLHVQKAILYYLLTQ